jgi:enterochelin esterase-like enzyme
MARFFAILLVCLCTGASLPADASSTVLTRVFYSDTLNRDWAYTVYLPDGNGHDGGRLPVVYLLHGNNGNCNDWIAQGHLQTTVDTLIEHKEIPPVVIVMPQGGTDWYVDRKEPIETAFFADLIPQIEHRYRVSNRREDRIIGGTSMGGFGALRYALTRPELFSAAILLSPAIYANEPPITSAARRVDVFGAPRFDPRVWKALNYPAQWNAYMRQPLRVPMFIAAGDDDLVIQAEASQLYTRLRAWNNPAALRIVGGGHTWDVWRGLIGEALKYAFASGRGRAGAAAPAPAPASDHP